MQERSRLEKASIVISIAAMVITVAGIIATILDRAMRESSAPRIKPPDTGGYVINVSDSAIGYSDAFWLGKLAGRTCQRCFALVLDGMTLPHNLWHDGKLS